ncbi:MAG: helicase-related protein, partial [Opitutales bacterium]
MLEDRTGNTLPIGEHLQEIIGGLRKGGPILLSAPTGSGKSTQVPQFVADHYLESGQVIYVTQPRRVAVRALARRVASERGTRLGDRVGYEMRFDRCVSDNTRIIYLTEGVLLRKLLGSDGLVEAGAVMLDEFHERTVNADLCLALIKRLQDELRPDLKLLVSSATLNSKPLIEYLPGCTVIESDGRTFPVRVEHASDGGSHATPVWERVCKHLGRLASEEKQGDFLVFLPGAYEIRRTIEALQGFPATRQLHILPLHGDLSAEAQDAALAHCAGRKVVVSTNVAETSLTIEGVCLVIDSGLAKKAGHDPRRGVNTLLTEKISRASATQRAGRAGRTAPGRCIRLWSASDHRRRTDEETPEIHRIDLSETILSLMASGYDPREFQWFDAPAGESLDRAIQLLERLGAIHRKPLAITSLGRQLAALPTHPRHARVLIEAKNNDCPRTAALAIALTQTRSILLGGNGKLYEELMVADELRSDFIPAIRAWEMAAERGFDIRFCREWGIHAGRSREVGRIRDQILRGMSLTDEPAEHWNANLFARSLLAGYPEQVAKRTRSGSSIYALAEGGHGELRRGSELRGIELLVSTEIEEIAHHGKARLIMGLSTEIREEWLQEIFPERFVDHRETAFDPETRSVAVRRTRRFGQLIFERQSLGEPSP